MRLYEFTAPNHDPDWVKKIDDINWNNAKQEPPEEEQEVDAKNKIKDLAR